MQIFRDLRNSVIEIVLATDMSTHFVQIKTMKNMLTLPEGQGLTAVVEIFLESTK